MEEYKNLTEALKKVGEHAEEIAEELNNKVYDSLMQFHDDILRRYEERKSNIP